ncbi:unnamed protein product [Anisakis simplex]|uniref:Helix-loop-helix protein 11 (inferred by orthology to a C. elegans protein) n=1 Tax=Anisakis simplex TaxID=6269 RepID=A0A0M3JZ68_ANISI|nr:unnamed protein product [Anisakis simplex]
MAPVRLSGYYNEYFVFKHAHTLKRSYLVNIRIHTASSSCRGGEDDTSPPNGVISCSLTGSEELSDRRIRRQIANCNERRRMQSINAGFQSLRSLLPKRDGEKMSKAAILQHTAELIQSLQAEKMRLLEEKEAAIQAKKRRIEDEESRERGLVDELTVALEQERRLRQIYEQQLIERRERDSILSPISTLPTPSQLASSIVDSTLMRPRTDLAGLLPHAMALDSLVGATTAPPTAYVRLDAASALNPTTNVTSSTLSLTTNGDANANATIATTTNNNTSTNSGFKTPTVTCIPQTSASASASNNGFIGSATSASTIVDGMPQAPLLMNSMENHSTANLSHRNLNAILEAIRHLEGGAGVATANNNMIVANSTPQHSNVLVR